MMYYCIECVTIVVFIFIIRLGLFYIVRIFSICIWNPILFIVFNLVKINYKEESEGSIMEEMELSSAAIRNQAEIKELERKSGVKITDCYQCGKCSAGCPVAFAMDKSPRQIIRLLQLGMLDEALKSRTIWLCATCHTCSTRCPRDVDLATLMETTRQLAKKKGIVAERTVDVFSDIFLFNVKTFGKSPEVLLSALYNLRSGKLFQDIGSVPKLFSSGKAHVIPGRVKDRKNIKRIFEKCMERGE